MHRLPVLESPAGGPAPDPGEMADAARELAASIEGDVRFGLHDRMLYATDASLYQVEPLGVVIPRSIDDALRAIEVCARRRLPILPRGGGSSLAGQTTNRAVVIDFSAHCRGVGEMRDDHVTVEPGVVLDELNDELAGRGVNLFFGPDVATSRHANLGGMIGNNSAGSRSIRYGRTSEHVAALDVALIDAEARVQRVRFDRGAATRDPHVRALTEQVLDVVRRHETLIRERFPSIVRHVDGYLLDSVLKQIDDAASQEDALARVNLASMICGSEGTLGVTLGAELHLSPVPVARALTVVGFSSLTDAIGAVNLILETDPSAVELLDDMVIELARRNREMSRYVRLLPGGGEGVQAVLYVEHDALNDAGELAARFEALRRTLPGAPMEHHTDSGAMAQAWTLRKAGEPLLHGVPGLRKPITFIEDTAVDPRRLPEFVADFQAMLDAHGLRAAFYAHASVGCLHIRPLLDIRDPGDEALMVRIAEEATDLVRRYDGALSGEHGDGRVRSPLLERYFGPELMGAFREIKRIFDPLNLMNPGNIVDAGPPSTIPHHTRVNPKPGGRPARIDPSVDTYFTYHDQHDFDGAVSMCNGAGVCRRTSGGVMCPSYMATRDERHATRGRGNALRLAISGQFTVDSQTGGSPADQSGRPRWNDRGTMETLDLCLSCKACKTECPSNVDIARLKSEYTAQRYRRHGGASLADRVLSRVRILNRLGALTPGIANAVNASAPARFIINRLLDVHPKRTLPRFEGSLYRWFSRRSRAESSRPRVALFADCFCAYNETSIGRDAVRLLQALGYEVVLPRHGCCGRPAISLGLLDDAIKAADRALDDLQPLIDDVSIQAILTLEPSCLSAMLDDWLLLKLRTPIERRRALADRAMSVERFVAERWASHPGREAVEAALDREAGPALVHGHCHQKAITGARDTLDALRRFGYDADMIDATCCGMAGSFGFARRRYELSMAIGELGVLPAARAFDAGPLCAPGTSCRHQILDGAGRTALHPVQAMWSRVEGRFKDGRFEEGERAGA